MIINDNDMNILCGISNINNNNIEIEEDSELNINEIFISIEEAIIESNLILFNKMYNLLLLKISSSNHYNRIKETIKLGECIINGTYLDILRHPFTIELFTEYKEFLKNPENDLNEDHIAIQINKFLINTLENKKYNDDMLFKSYIFLIYYIGITCLNLFVQFNYTGPVINKNDVLDVYSLISFMEINENNLNKINQLSLINLQVDGESPYIISEYPQFLVISRIFLHFIGNGMNNIWCISYHDKGKVTKHNDNNNNFQPAYIKSLTSFLTSSSWWCGRAGIVHERLMLKKERSPTIYNEVKTCFNTMANKIEMFVSVNKNTYVTSRFYIEYGLMEYLFNDSIKAKEKLDIAKDKSCLSINITGALGKRTKYQIKDLPQMVIQAKSKITNNQTNKQIHENKEISDDDLDKSSNNKTEICREVTLDEANPDNILLESISFLDKKVEDKEKDENLQVMDQVLLLAYCLDVNNTNPKNGLTREQMFPYLTRVLYHPNNWMVYSTALLEKANLECETCKTKERAVLQMQALVDQHTTQLTVTQSTFDSIHNAAPANERIKYIYSLWFPPRYALKKNLAEQYCKLGIIRSALEIFTELEMWDEVVECYQAIEQPKKAEKLVRERLLVSESPFMWCCLGDLTNYDETCYLTAWTLSKRRYARAKRSLGKIAYKKNKKKEAMNHLIESLEVAPMNIPARFLLGSIAMQCSEWNIGLNSFTRIVQIDPNNGEAWGNLGSIHLRLQNYSAAFSALQEGLKQKRNMWQMWENYVLCAMEIEKYGNAIYGLHQLLDLRKKHNRPVDHEILAWLVESIIYPETFKSNTAQSDDNNTLLKKEECTDVNVDLGNDLHDDNIENIEVTDTSPLYASNINYKKQLIELFGRITSIVTNDPKIWQIYARLNDGFDHRNEKALECRLKRCRSLQIANWYTDEKSMTELAHSTYDLVENYLKFNKKEYIYAAKLYVRNIIDKIKIYFSEHNEYKKLIIMLEKIENIERK